MRTQSGQTIHLKDYREPDYWVRTVDLDFDLHPQATKVTSRLMVERNCSSEKSAAIRLDGDELTLLSVSIEGVALSSQDYDQKPDCLTLKKPPQKRTFEICVETEISPATNKKLMGLYRTSGIYCTQCEAQGFRRITFFPDRPDILAVYTTRIEADRKQAPVLLGNGNFIKKGAASNGRHYAIWHDPHPKPSYLFALVAGDLGSIHKPFKTASGRKVKLGIYVEKGKEDRAHYAMDSLVRSMRWDEDVFGCEYDLDVFNIVAVSDFNMGAMENKGLNVFNDKYVLADAETATDADFASIEAIVAHEYFHNWTGNRITCRDWFQLCLKEGLTVYRDQEFSADQRSRPVKRIADVKRLIASQFPEDAGPLAHPVRPKSYREINNFYTATVYEKGAELVRMLATLLGEKFFRKGMRLYLTRHDGEAAAIEQFIACFEDASGKDLKPFMRWYEQAGTPLLNIASHYDSVRKKLILEIEQLVPPTPGQHRKAPHLIPLAIGLVGKTGTDLQPTSTIGVEHSHGVLQLVKRKHRIAFGGIGERPCLSLNRGFSAPVEINYRQSNRELAFLATRDSDSFGRWQAHSALSRQLIIEAVRNVVRRRKPLIASSFLEISLKLGCDETLEHAFRAALLSLPSDGELAQEIGKNVDPEAIAKAISLYSKALGKALHQYRQTILRGISTKGPYSPDAGSAGKRALIATLNHYGVISGIPDVLKTVEEHYFSADNMTDRYNALLAIVHHGKSRTLRERVLGDFHERFKDDPIVLDKWFAVQASRPGSATAASIARLMKHPDFKLENPNRARALIGTFAMTNLTGFNAASGNGYKLVGDVVAKLDKINPQVAARLLTAFRSFKSLEAKRRKMAVSVLKRIEAEKNLSKGVSEILERTLAQT